MSAEPVGFGFWNRGANMQQNVPKNLYGPGMADADTIRDQFIRITGLEAQKDAAYKERDSLVCALSKLFPAVLGRHPKDEPWEDDWRWIVFIFLPTGQASWHINDAELPMFEHLAVVGGKIWDGHTTDEKYNRLAELKPSVEKLKSVDVALAA